MDEAIKILNELEQKGLIERYAIGGGIAVLFYIEPVFTVDLDVFCLLPATPKGKLILLSPIYEYLRTMGFKVHKEQVIVDSVPVQFIPAYNELVEEAVKECRTVKYKNVGVKVVKLEYLMAIMLQTYRPKDRERLVLVLDEAKLDNALLDDILSRHGLLARWKEFKISYEK